MNLKDIEIGKWYWIGADCGFTTASKVIAKTDSRVITVGKHTPSGESWTHFPVSVLAEAPTPKKSSFWGM